MNDDLREQLKRVFDEYKKSKADPVRVGILGQPGAGKSSLINSITGQDDLAPVGVSTDHTVTATEYAWNEIKLVDLPGYGTESFPKDGFLERFGILKFDALLCVTNSKFRDEDCEFFRTITARRRPCLFVRTNLDGLRQKGKNKDELREGIKNDLAKQLRSQEFRLLFVDNISSRGISELNEAIVALLTPARRDKYYRWAKGTSDDFLAHKRQACNSLIAWYAAGSAANAFNPIPGTGIAVDLGMVTAMQTQILLSFGFTVELLRNYMDRYSFLASVIGPLLNTVGREAVALLVARFAGKEAAKWVPIFGPLLSASAGAALVYYAGTDIADHCLEIAKRVRDAEMAEAA